MMDERRASGRSRRKASRILAERRRKGAATASCDDESPTRERAKPPRRKKREPLFEEDVVDGFAILSFKTYEDIELSLNGGKPTTKNSRSATNTISGGGVHNNNNNNSSSATAAKYNHGGSNGVAAPLTATAPPASVVLAPEVTVKQEPPPESVKTNHHHKIGQDPGTSDDSCREKDKRLGGGVQVGDVVIKRDPESEDNRLSDASSRCSSGRGYLCDSEDDDKASDSGSVLLSPPAVRKRESSHEVGSDVVNGHGGVTIKTSNSPRPESPAMAPPPMQQPQSMAQPKPSPNHSNHFSPIPNGVAKLERMSPVSIGVSSPRTVTSVGPAYARPGYPPNIHPGAYPPPPTLHHQPPSHHLHHHHQPMAPQQAPISLQHHHHQHHHQHQQQQQQQQQQPHHHQQPPPQQQVSAHHHHHHHQQQQQPTPPQPTHQPQQPSPLSLPPVGVGSGPTNPAGVVAPPPHSVSTGPCLPSPVVAAPPQPTAPMSPYHPPLYAPYNNTPYMPPSSHQAPPSRSPMGMKPVTTTGSGLAVTTATTTSHSHMINTPLVGRTHSPRGHSPTRERDSYSSNVSSLSRGSMGTPSSIPPYSVPHHPAPSQSSLSYNKSSAWVSGSAGATPSSAVAQPPPAQVSPAPRSSLGPHHHPFPPPIFPPTSVASAAAVAAAAAAAAGAIPPPVSNAAPQPTPTVPIGAPNPFSAESLFQSSKTNQGDMLRRELDTRFLATQDRGPYIRTEMHHHQHQHTHVHQHTTPIMPPPPPTLFSTPIVSTMFKDMPKGATVESPFYRQSLGFTGYPGYSPGLLHPGFGATTPFAPPTHIPTFTPKQLTEPSKPKTVKTGKWNAMHVRVAWEIYHHQQKGGASTDSKVASLMAKSELLRPPTHMFGPPLPYTAQASHRSVPPPYDPAPPSFPPSIGGSVFGRYPPSASYTSLPTFPPHGTPLHPADPWSRLQPRVPSQAYPPPGPWAGLKPDPLEVEREKERERSRERDRARREEKQRQRLASVNKVRDRSPLREPAPQMLSAATSKEEEAAALMSRSQHYLAAAAAARHPPRPLGPHFAPSPWDHPYRYDPLRYNPLVAAALREEEEQRAKLFAAYPGGHPPGLSHLRPSKAPSPAGVHRLGQPSVMSHQPKEEPNQSR